MEVEGRGGGGGGEVERVRTKQTIKLGVADTSGAVEVRVSMKLSLTLFETDKWRTRVPLIIPKDGQPYHRHVLRAIYRTAVPPACR